MKRKPGAPKGSQHALKGDVVASEHIHIRVLPEFKAKAKAKAKSEGLTFTEWVLRAVSRQM
jgi:hypothetical protein